MALSRMGRCTPRAVVLLILWSAVAPASGLAVRSESRARSRDRQGAAIVINGLGGLPEFEENFVDWATRLRLIFSDKFGEAVYYLDGRTQRKEEILKTFDRVASEGGDEVWLVLIGHANHDGKSFKFHVKGPDLTGKEIRSFLDLLGSRKVFVVAGTSASGVLISELQGENRVIVTATRNQFERQPPLFLSFFLEAAESPDADRNKNGRVSLLEAFLFSRTEVQKWFLARGLLQTEHALLDDQGEIQLGSEEEAKSDLIHTGEGMLAAATYFSSPPEEAYRTAEARELSTERQGIEREIEALKFRKQKMPVQDYCQELERLLIDLARLNEQIAELEKPR